MESSCQEVISLAEKVLNDGEITEEEAKRLIRTCLLYTSRCV